MVNDNQKKVITLGTFDLFHIGHLNLLKRCRLLGKVIVGLNSDEFIKRYKGKYPVMNEKERVDIIMATELVDLIYINEQKDNTIKDVLDKCYPDYIVIGSDWLRKDYLGQIGLTIDDLEERNISLVYVPYTKNISTTELKKRIADYVK